MSTVWLLSLIYACHLVVGDSFFRRVPFSLAFVLTILWFHVLIFDWHLCQLIRHVKILEFLTNTYNFFLTFFIRFYYFFYFITPNIYISSNCSSVFNLNAWRVYWLYIYIYILGRVLEFGVGTQSFHWLERNLNMCSFFFFFLELSGLYTSR